MNNLLSILIANVYSSETKAPKEQLGVAASYSSVPGRNHRDRLKHEPHIRARAILLITILPSSLSAFAQGGGYVPTEVTDDEIAHHMDDAGQHPVGSTGGVADVSAIGSASYSIPLYVAPGTNGIQPALSINYSSMAGDGPMGCGWNIGELSAITRVGMDQYHDNACSAVALDALADRFTLDGQRLMVTSGSNYFAPDAHYDTETAQFNFCVAHGQVAGGPAYFTRVVKETGRTYEYGGGAPGQHAQVFTGNSPAVYSWLLDKVQDAYGNYMTFTYNQSDLQPRIERIDYTANDNTGLSSYNAVVFDYFSRSDVNEMFIKNISGLKTSKLLKSVTMYCEGQAFKQYQFNYCLRDHGKSYLREIVEGNGDMSAVLNSTLVKYGDMAPEPWHDRTTGTSIPTDADIFSGDFDGDGRSELLAVPYTIDGETGNRLCTELRVYDGDGNGGLSNSPAWTTGLSSSSVSGQQSSVQTYESNLSHDMDGDGRDDIISAQVTYFGNAPEPFKYKMVLGAVNVYLSTSTPDDAQPNHIHFSLSQPSYPGSGHLYPTRSQSAVPWPLHPNFMMVGDFNGDGFGDFLCPFFDGNSEMWQMRFVSPYHRDLNGVLDPIYHNVSCGSSDNIGTMATALNVIVSDFDGDGAAEVLMSWPTFSTIVKLTADYNLISLYTGSWPRRLEADAPNQGHSVYPLDFNGDGKTDLLSHWNNNPDWYVSYFNGHDFSYSTDLTSSFAQFYSQGLPYIDSRFVHTGDFDGDGRSDIVVVHFHGYHMFHIFYSRGSGQQPYDVDFSNYPSDIATSQNTGSEATPLNFYLGPLVDLDGDGRAEMLNFHEPTIHVLTFQAEKHQQRVESIVDGLGNLVSFDWNYATSSAVHFQGTDFTWPNGDVNPPLPVVATLYRSDGVGGLRGFSHVYGIAKVNRRGKGFLGFMEHYASDWAMNRLRVNSNTLVQDNIGFGFLAPYATQDFRMDDNELLSNAILNNSFQHLNDPARYLHTIQSSSSLDALSGAQTITTNQSGAYGEILSSVTDVGNGLEVITTTSTYDTFGPSLAVAPDVPNRETTHTEQHARSGSPAVVSTTQMDYYHATGALKHQVDFANLPAKARTTDYEYTTCGNVAMVTTNSADLAATDQKQETFEYEQPRSRFVTKHSSRCNAPLNAWISEKIATDPVWGKETTHSGFDHLVTETAYDDWGRIRSRSVPYANGQPRYDITFKYAWAVDEPAHEVSAVYTIDPGGSDLTEWFDQLGRSVRKEETMTFGMRHSLTTYYDFGGKSSETTPHFDGEDFIHVNHSFDEYRRPWMDDNSLVGTTEYLYSFGLGTSTVTATDPGSHINVRTTDAAGRLVHASDDGGTLDYSYDSRGNTTKVSKGGATLEQITYDPYGRRASLTDADGGTTNYTYDGLGRLTWQQDANGNGTLLTYDNHDRLLTRTEVEGTTTYDYYYQNGAYMDAPKKISRPNMYVSYDYDDPLLRCTKETRYYSGTNFVTGHTYDPVYDRLTGTTYPNGFDVQYSYFDEDGALERVSHAGATIFATNHINGSGQFDEFKKGDGIVTSIDYYDGFPLSITAQNVLDLHNTFNYHTGNLTERWDNIPSRGEEFTYDFLDRLTGSTVSKVNTAGVPQTFVSHYDYSYDGSQYDTKGDLVQKTDIGKFGYGSSYGAVASARGVLSGSPPAMINYLNTQDITYTSFSKARSIDEAVNEVSYHLDYDYGVDHQRYRSRLLANGSSTITRWYAEMFEQQIDQTMQTTTDICYINAGDGLTAMAVRQNGGQDRIYYVYKDQLDNIVALTHADGQLNGIAAQQNFDAWGRRRNPQTWTYDNLPTNPAWLYRGFTGHEHVDVFALINMNGRMYDPLNGRMLSADNYVEGSMSSQGFNRYSYCGNNPLKFTDPSGDFWFLPVAIGFATSFVTTGLKTHNWLQAFGNGVSGAIFAGASYGIGASAGLFASSSLCMSAGSASLFGSVAGGTTSGLLSAVTMGSGHIGTSMAVGFGSGLLGGALSNLDVNSWGWQGAINATAGGLYGGAVSEWMGGSFGEGAATGFIASAVGWGVNRAVRQQVANATKQEQTEGDIMSELSISSSFKLNEIATAFDKDNMKDAQLGADTWVKWYELRGKWLDLYGTDKNGNLSTNFDFKGQTLKFGHLHIRPYANSITYHYDHYNIVTSPIRHILFDTLWQGMKYHVW